MLSVAPPSPLLVLCHAMPTPMLGPAMPSTKLFLPGRTFTSTVQVLAEISDKLEDDSVFHVSSVSADVVLGVFRDSGQSEMSVE